MNTPCERYLTEPNFRQLVNKLHDLCENWTYLVERKRQEVADENGVDDDDDKTAEVVHDGWLEAAYLAEQFVREGCALVETDEEAKKALSDSEVWERSLERLIKAKVASPVQ